MVKIYTRGGDDGSTALRVGGRVRKDDPLIDLVGTIDESQAALGLCRAELERSEALDVLLTAIERDLWILMAEVMTAPDQRERARPGVSLVTAEMVEALEAKIDEVTSGLDLAANFAVPGENRRAATLDFARTVVRRAERLYVSLGAEDSFAGPYLNRLSDLCWTLARAQEVEHQINKRETKKS